MKVKVKPKAAEPPAWDRAVEQFLAAVKLRRSVHTWANYRSDLAQFKAFYAALNGVEPGRASDVTFSDLRQWHRSIAESPGRARRAPGREGKAEARGPAMPATVNRKLASVHSFLKWAALQGYI